jgi:hypothetical protein
VRLQPDQLKGLNGLSALLVSRFILYFALAGVPRNPVNQGHDMYGHLSDQEFVGLLFTAEDQLGHDYLEQAKSRRSALVPLLCDILADERNYQFDDERFWAVIHAVQILGILGDPRALDALILASEYSDVYDIDWIWEALPECYFQIGLDAIPKLKVQIENTKAAEDFTLSNEIAGLWNLWAEYPEARDDIESFLLGIIESPDCNLTLRAYLIADFAQINRNDLKPLFNEFFDRGVVDLNTFSRDDMDHFLNEVNRVPGFRRNLEAFYSREEQQKRRERWQKDDEYREKKAIESYILENLNRIGRNEKCPCGSGKKFKRCHLLWAEEETRRLHEQEDRFEVRTAIMIERETESALRQFFAGKDQLHLFDEFKEQALTAVKAPDMEFRSRGLMSYFEPIFSQIVFDDQAEAEYFSNLFQDYFNSLVRQFEDHPRNGRPVH